MKIETHAHTKEGSLDGRVSIFNTIDILRNNGYDGMIVTDHNSYSGYSHIKENYDDFVIFKGIEYDTSDGGHMLIILPKGVQDNIFTHKGMSVKDTIEVVHNLGGIVGPAHPFDYYKLGIMNNAKWLRNLDVIKDFDFIETFNACGSKIGNHKSKSLAKLFNKPGFGGSDSHRTDVVGKAHTILPEKVKNENELIDSVKKLKYGDTRVYGDYSSNKTSDKLGFVYQWGLKSFYGVGKVSSVITRRRAMQLAIALSLLSTTPH